jgi:hypothetical protein
MDTEVEAWNSKSRTCYLTSQLTRGRLIRELNHVSSPDSFMSLSIMNVFAPWQAIEEREKIQNIEGTLELEGMYITPSLTIESMVQWHLSEITS